MTALPDANTAETIIDARPQALEDPASRRALVFPGQGSQSVGMGLELARRFEVARAVFEEVDDALGQKLSALMADGPEDQLTLTENAQPALMAVSMAVLRVLEAEFGCGIHRLGRFVAGHSLGEYTALTAAGSFTVADAARLLRIRGLAMQTAVPVGEGAMAALMGVELATAREIAAEATRDSYDGAVCVAANDNAPGQVVISGSRAAVQRAIEIAALRGAKRSVLLPVSGPFHCPLMAPVADVMADALASVRIKAPQLPLVSNVTAQQVTEPDEIRRLLVRQVTGMVRWRESVLFMYRQGVEELVEIGTGKVLSGLARRIDRRLSGFAIGSPGDIEAFVATV
jgi:[acyl-carrier-protein] S-malonyltransferase